MENNIKQSRLDFSCGAGAAGVNLFTGGLLFERPDLSIGANSFAFGVSHTYDSRAEVMDMPAGIDTFTGSKWRLNIQQYIKESGNGYIYLDGAGFSHEFENYHEYAEGAYTITKYFDRTGFGKTLFVKKSGQTFISRYIEDKQGNKLEFDNKGRLKETVSCQNAGIKKRISYDGATNKLSSIYDDRKPSRKITFLYGTNGLLSEMRCTDDQGVKHIVYYAYDIQNNLTGVSEYANGDKRSAVLYKYDNSGRLKYAVRCGTESALKFEYDGDGRISKVSAGVMKILPLWGEEKPTLYVGQDIFCGQAYCGQTMREFIGFEVSGNDGDFKHKTYTAFTYNTESGIHNSTTVTNEKGIAIDYFFNAKGFTAGILERRNGSANDLMTLTKDSGTGILQTADTSEKINNEKTIKITNKSYDFSENEISVIRDNVNKEKEKAVVSFWVKHKMQPGENCTGYQARIVVKYYMKWDKITQPGYLYFDKYLDHTAYNSWQYVTIPIKYITNANVIGEIYNEVKLSFLTGNDTGDIYVSNMRISKESPALKFKIANGVTRFYDLETFKQIKLEYNAGGPSTENIDASFFMSETDVKSTSLNVQKNPEDFEGIFNNGTKIIPGIKYLTLISSAANVLFSQNTPPFAYRLEDSIDNNDIFITTLFKYLDDGILQQTTASDGTHVSKQEVKTDYNGRLIYNLDEYGVKTSYEYDNYGNPARAEVQNLSGGDILKYEYAYDQNGNPSMKEHVTETRSNNIPAYFAYNDPAATLSMSNKSGGWVKEYKYDSFNRLIGVYQKDGNSIKSQNNITYDDYGRIGSLSDGGSHRFTFGYNGFGDITEYNTEYIGNGETVRKKMLEKEYDYVNGTILEKVYSDNNTTISETSSTVNKYGQTASVKDHTNDLITAFEYQPVNESPSVAKILNISDPYDGQTYEYRYDDENRPCGYGAAGGSIKIQQTASNKTKYTFNGMDYETEIGYDPNKLSAPRINKTKYRTKSSSAGASSWVGAAPYEFDYFYDSLGRLGGNDEDLGKRIGNKTEIWYKLRTGPSGIKDERDILTWTPSYRSSGGNSSMLIDSVNCELAYKSNISSSDTKNLTYDYSYDPRGNITGITEKTVNNGTTTRNKDIVYTYDGGDKIETENNAAFDINRRYIYNNRGQITEIWDCGTTPETLIKSFTYDALGRLNSANGTVYAHNNYGNTTKIGGAPVSWTRGRYLSSYSGNEYFYNHQGVRFKKTAGGVTTTYYNDGSRILGEDRGSTKLRYFYNATGLAGFSCNNDKYLYIKDGLGNISGIVKAESTGNVLLSGTKSAIVCLYAYDAWGNCKVLNAGGGTAGIPDIAYTNPFRWKSRYYDSETGWIYNEGRYYDPAIGQYIDADAPENLLLNSAVINGLNRYGITTDNAVALVGALYNIFTATKLYTDPDYKAGFDWRIVIDIVIIAALIVLSFAANPVGFLAANLVAMGFAISGAIIGGIVSFATGNDFWDGAAKGARIGYAVGMLVYSVVSITMAVRATVNAPDAARVAESTKPSNSVATETAAAQPEKYSPINQGPLDAETANSFSGGSYSQKTLTEDTTMYRVYGGKAGKVGRFMTKTPQNGGMQSQIDLALKLEWGNTAEYVTTVIVPKGTIVFEGTVASQGYLFGGGNQIYILEVNPLWFL